MEPNEYIEMVSLEKRLETSQKFNNKLSTIVVVPLNLRKIKGISFYKFVFDEDISTQYVELVVKKVILTSKFYLVDHRNNLLKKLKSCCVEEDGNIYLYVRSI